MSSAYQWDFGVLINFWGLWFNGVVLTVLLSVGVVLAGTLLGILLVVGLKSHSTPIRLATRTYVDVFRAIPALVLLGTIFFCLPLITGVVLSPFSTSLLALSLNLSPFASECMRAGIDSIPTVQYDSARMLGFRGWQLSYYIIGPQAVRRILPPLAGQWVTSMKLTSLAATIGVPELWNVTGQVVTNTSLPLESRIMGAALYVLIILPCLWGVIWLERLFEVKGLGQQMRMG